MTDAPARTTFACYPCCARQGSAKRLDESLRAIVPELGMELRELDDGNCCGASVGHVGGKQLANMAPTRRNLANAQKQGREDVVTGWAACYLNTHGGNEKIKAGVDEALGAGGLSDDAELTVRHIREVIGSDVGIDRVKEKVKYMGPPRPAPSQHRPARGNNSQRPGWSSQAKSGPRKQGRSLIHRRSFGEIR